MKLPDHPTSTDADLSTRRSRRSRRSRRTLAIAVGIVLAMATVHLLRTALG